MTYTRTDEGLISPEVVRNWMLEGKPILLLDISTEAEFIREHIPGSRRVLLSEVEILAKKTGNRDLCIVTYCKNGKRSAVATEKLRTLGFKNVYNLGAIDNWPYEVEFF